MNGLDVVPLNQLSRCWHTQVIDDALSRLLKRLCACGTLTGGAEAQLWFWFRWGKISFSPLCWLDCLQLFLLNWSSRIYWLEAGCNLWFGLLSANLNYWGSFGAYWRSCLTWNCILYWGIFVVQRLRGLWVVGAIALANRKSSLRRNCAKCLVFKSGTGILLYGLLGDRIRSRSRWWWNRRVSGFDGSLVSIEVDLTSEWLDEDLAALWSLKRLAFLDSVDAHGLFRGLWHVIIIPVAAIFYATVFLTQRRSCFEKIQIRMTLLKAGFWVCMKLNSMTILELLIKIRGKRRGSVDMLALDVVSLVTHGHRGYLLRNLVRILPH